MTRLNYKSGETVLLEEIPPARSISSQCAGVMSITTGKPAYVLGHAADITELKRAEQRLRTAEQRFQQLLEFSSDVVTIAQPDGSIQFISPAVERALGILTTRYPRMKLLLQLSRNRGTPVPSRYDCETAMAPISILKLLPTIC